MSDQFQSTPPARGATFSATTETLKHQFQSTPPARGATRERARIAIGDDVSIHAPRAGGDIGTPTRFWHETRFQSTPPARGATTSLLC